MSPTARLLAHTAQATHWKLASPGHTYGCMIELMCLRIPRHALEGPHCHIESFSTHASQDQRPTRLGDHRGRNGRELGHTPAATLAASPGLRYKRPVLNIQAHSDSSTSHHSVCAYALAVRSTLFCSKGFAFCMHQSCCKAFLYLCNLVCNQITIFARFLASTSPWISKASLNAFA